MSAPKLLSTTLFVRIRPLDADGAAPGHAMGEEMAIKLEGWDESSVTMIDSSGKRRIYDYPTRVLIPEVTQEDAYNAALPVLVHAWLNECNNLMVLAYGQTGTGKTHTMFGPKESLASEALHPDWGVLPRVVHECFEHMRAQRGRVNCILTGSALEFYMGCGYDLLNDHTPIEVNPEGEAHGHVLRVMENMSDFSGFLEDLERNRTTAATRMNSSSSRSHCCMLLTLFQMNLETREYVVTKFNLIDLAGSERAARASVGGQPLAGPELYKYVILAMKGEGDKVPVVAQGQFINWELSALTMEIMSATEQHKHRRKYNPRASCSTDFQRYTGAIMVGRTRLTTVVCVSPAPQNGLENLNSLKWGHGMAKLRAPNITEKPVDIEKAHTAAVEYAKKTAKEFEGSPQNRFWAGRKSRCEHAAVTLNLIERLMSAA